jgi:hypothetical protein
MVGRRVDAGGRRALFDETTAVIEFWTAWTAWTAWTIRSPYWPHCEPHRIHPSHPSIKPQHTAMIGYSQA